MKVAIAFLCLFALALANPTRREASDDEEQYEPVTGTDGYNLLIRLLGFSTDIKNLVKEMKESTDVSSVSDTLGKLKNKEGEMEAVRDNFDDVFMRLENAGIAEQADCKEAFSHLDDSEDQPKGMRKKGIYAFGNYPRSPNEEFWQKVEAQVQCSLGNLQAFTSKTDEILKSMRGPQKKSNLERLLEQKRGEGEGEGDRAGEVSELEGQGRQDVKIGMMAAALKFGLEYNIEHVSHLVEVIEHAVQKGEPESASARTIEALRALLQQARTLDKTWEASKKRFLN